ESASTVMRPAAGFAAVYPLRLLIGAPVGGKIQEAPQLLYCPSNAIERTSIPYPVIDIRVRKQQKLFEGGEPLGCHLWNACRGKAAQDEIKLFGAPMVGAIKRALAPKFKPVHEMPCGSRPFDGTQLPSFAQYRRMRDSFQFQEAPLPWKVEEKFSSSLGM